MRAERLTTAFVSISLLVGCSRSAPAQPSPTIAWLDCVECTPQQLQAVAALGDQVVPEFRTVLLRGPDAARLTRERVRLQMAYREMKEYEQRHPQNAIAMGESQYLNLYLSQFVLRNRVRAARALGAINTQNARIALREALSIADLPDQLRAEITRALAPAEPVLR
jgi:hypothetical protein